MALSGNATCKTAKVSALAPYDSVLDTPPGILDSLALLKAAVMKLDAAAVASFIA